MVSFVLHYTFTHCKRPWCWEGLGAGGEGDGRGSDGWMASPTRWPWVWVNSGSLWWTGRPGVLWFMGSQSWTWLSDWTELNWIEYIYSHTWFICGQRLTAPSEGIRLLNLTIYFDIQDFGDALFSEKWFLSFHQNLKRLPSFKRFLKKII